MPIGEIGESVPEVLLGIAPNESKPAESRLKNGASARLILKRMIDADEQSGRRRAVVDGWVAGNPPYRTPRAKGREWEANLNFMGGKALMDSSAVPYYQIFDGVEYYAETKTAHQPKHPDHQEWSGKIARRFHNMCSRWKQGGFDWNIQAASYHMRKHGIGPCFFERHNDWRFRAIPSGMVLADKDTPSCVGKRHRKLAIRVPYSVVELWEFIKDEATATALGWDVEAVKTAIKRAGQGLLGDDRNNWYSSPWETFQRRLMDDDLRTSAECESVACAHLLVQEFNGKITHVVVTETEVVPDQNPGEIKDEDFLFRHANRYDSFDQALVVFFQNMGEGTWHSVRGLADDAFKHGEVENRLMCRMVDGAFIGSSLVIKPGNTPNKDKLQLTQFGAVTLLPAGAEIQQTNLHGALDGPIMVHRIIRNQLSQNIGQAHPRSLSREDGRGEVPTKAQVDAEVSRDATLSQGQMSLFYQTLDTLYSEMFRRAADPNTTDEEAKQFQKECKEDGVPAKALTDMEYVRANRTSGYGSPQIRQMVHRQMLELGLVAMLPEDGKQNWLRMAVGSIEGADKVEYLVPREHVPSRDDADAAMENSMIKNGDMPVMISGQNDVIHLHAHLKHAADTLAPVNEALEAQQFDPAMLQSAYEYLQIMGAHIEQHVARLRGDASRAQMAKMFEAELNNLVSFNGKLRRAIIQVRREAELAARQEEQATALGALDQARVESTYSDIENKRRKTDASIATSATKTLNQIRLKQLQTAATIADQRTKALAQPERSAA